MDPKCAYGIYCDSLSLNSTGLCELDDLAAAFALESSLDNDLSELSSICKTSAAELVGCRVDLFCPVDRRVHTARITGCRHDETTGVYEHSLLFKRLVILPFDIRYERTNRTVFCM